MHNTRVRLPTILPQIFALHFNAHCKFTAYYALTRVQTLSQIRSLTSLILGVAAGILGLESQYGFLFYFISQIIISAFIHFLLADGKPGLYFAGSGAAEDSGNGNAGAERSKERIGAWREIWLSSGMFEGLSGFVLGWAGVGGVIR